MSEDELGSLTEVGNKSPVNPQVEFYRRCIKQGVVVHPTAKLKLADEGQFVQIF